MAIDGDNQYRRCLLVLLLQRIESCNRFAVAAAGRKWPNLMTKYWCLMMEATNEDDAAVECVVAVEYNKATADALNRNSDYFADRCC